MADWTQEDTEVPGDNTHLWEESWDDDDTSEDFSAQLKYALCHFLSIWSES
jgi:26 proteasome complex subunit DSS1